MEEVKKEASLVISVRVSRTEKDLFAAWWKTNGYQSESDGLRDVIRHLLGRTPIGAFTQTKRPYKRKEPTIP